MSKRQIIMLLGFIIIALAIVSGLPSVWNTVLYIVIGISIIMVAYLMRPAISGEPDPSAPFIDHSTSAHSSTSAHVPTPSLTSKSDTVSTATDLSDSVNDRT